MRPALIALGAIVACVLGLEALLRLAGSPAAPRTQPDPDLGWTLRPGPGINAAGVRDRPHLMHKGEEVFRIAVLGDAYSEGLALPVRSTWWRLLGARLEACAFQPGKKVEVLSFAVPGYGTAQEYVMLQTRAMRYRPDLVLLQFSRDDVRENSFALAARKDRPFFMLEPAGGLRIDESFATSPGFRRRMSLRWQVLERSRLVRWLLQDEAHAVASGAPALWDEAWRITESLIAGAAGFAARNGARFMLVSVPAERRLAEFARRSGIVSVHLAPGAAHATAADLVASALCPLGRGPAKEGL